MGLEFIRAKGSRFEQNRERSKLQELDTEELISSTKPNRIIRLYRCILTDPSAAIIGGLGLNLLVESQSEVRVLQHGRVVGCVSAEDVADLTIAMMRNNHIGGILSVTIVDEPALDGMFTIKPKTPFKT